MNLPDTLAGARQAALLLHTLDDSDRRWMLDQLPTAARSETERLLAELQALGMPSDRSLLDAVLADTSKRSTKAPPGRSHPLDTADAIQVARVLRGEPDGLIARLLKHASWSWHDAVLDELGPSRRRHIAEIIAELPDGAAPLERRLADAVARQLDRSVPGTAARPLSSWGALWARRIFKRSSW